MNLNDLIEEEDEPGPLPYIPDHHKEPLIKVEEADPTRCQIITDRGQCQFKSVPGLNKCILHGRSEAAKLKTDNKNKYILTQLGLDQALAENLTDKNILNLRNEIALTRVVLQSKLDSCKTHNDLAIAAGSIGQLVAQITQTVTLAHKLEESLNKYLDKAELKEFLIALGEAIEEVVKDDNLKFELGQRILRVAAPKLRKAI